MNNDPYRCVTCAAYWAVRALADDCCTPERRARLAFLRITRAADETAAHTADHIHLNPER